MISFRSTCVYRFAITGLTLACLVGGAASVHAETRVGGTLRGQNMWSKQGSPYIVTSDLTVEGSATLKIGPGVTVRFKPNIVSEGGFNDFKLELLVKGTLIVEGAANDSVFFTSDASSPAWDNWQGIVIQGPTAKLVAKNTVIEYALEGVWCLDGMVQVNNVTVRKCTEDGFRFLRGKGTLDGVIVTEVGNVSGTGMGINLEGQSQVDILNASVIGVQNGIVYAQHSGGKLHDSTVTMCISCGVHIHNANPDVRGCTITGNQIGIIASAGATPTVQGNNLFENRLVDVEVREGYETAPKLDFTHNWWGETTIGLIEERVLDGMDDPSRKAVVLLDPILDKSITESAPTGKP
jgi:parallel beta-helix repeat protein